MGRRKREIKPIKDKNSRQVTFSKRRKGLIKKAKELSVLCDVDVALVIFSNRGTLYDFSSTSSLTEMAQRYRSHMEVEKETPEGISGTEHSKYASFMTVGELLQTVERQLDKADDDDDTSLNDLVHLENQLQTALMQARSRKTDLMIESVKSLHEKEKQLREENKLLEDMINMKKKNKEVMNGMPLSFTNLAPIPMNGEQQRPTLNFL